VRVLYVVTCEIPSPAEVSEPIVAMNPPALPHFAGEVRVVVDPDAALLLAWLDGDAEMRVPR